MKSTPLIISLIIVVIVLLFAVSGMVNYAQTNTGSYIARAPAAVPMPLSQTGQRAVMPPYHDCYDSDGGKNFYEKGTTIVGNYYWTDYCDTKGDLVENICLYAVANQPQRGAVLYACPNGCKSGACIPSKTYY